MIFKEHILNLVKICYRKEIRNIVISPGSRSAPLTLAFAKYKKFQDFIVLDERSAAYIALGIAEEKKEIVALICTSGTAVLNYAPAIAEAFYKKIPILILTADRPPEEIDQYDNQTIRQNGIYNNYILKSYQLPVEPKTIEEINFSNRLINEAINTCTYPVKGPVHINIPLREPLYPNKNEEFKYNKNINIINHTNFKYKVDDMQYFIDSWKKYKKRMILFGMDSYDDKLNNILKNMKKTNSCLIIGDIISGKEDCINIYNHDFIFSSNIIKDYLPDLLITVGSSIVSKSTKTTLKKYGVKEHWHIKDDFSIHGDLYNSLIKIVNSDISIFFNNLNIEKEKNKFVEIWKKLDKLAFDKINNFFDTEEFNEFNIIKKIIEYLPKNINLNIGNSMIIRYFSLLSSKFLLEKNIKAYSNRGTSGIDGVLSTAIGHTLISNKLNLVILGDLSFIYDHNGIINNYISNNFSNKGKVLKIIILNNNGGGIFNIIDGPSKYKEKNKYFNTPQNYPIKALTLGFNHIEINSMKEFNTKIKDFFENNKTSILEIKTDMNRNTEFFNLFKLLYKDFF